MQSRASCNLGRRLALALLGIVICAFFAPSVHAAEPDFEGTYEMGKGVMKLAADSDSGAYMGTFEYKGKLAPVRAKVVNGVLTGKVGKLEFRARLSSDKLYMVANGKKYRMTRKNTPASASSADDAKPPSRVVHATIKLLEFRMGLLYNRFDFQMPAKYKRAIKDAIVKKWPSLSKTQRAKFEKMPAAWKKVDKVWDELSDEQKKQIAKKQQKKWMLRLANRAKKADDSQTRKKYKKQLAAYVAFHKKQEDRRAKTKQAQASKSKRQKSKKGKPSTEELELQYMRNETNRMAQEMLFDSMQQQRNAWANGW